MEFEWSLCWKMLMKVQSVEYSVRKTCTLRKMISKLTCSSGGFRRREGSYRDNRLILEILEHKLQGNFKFCKRRFDNNTYVLATDVLQYKSIMLSTSIGLNVYSEKNYLIQNILMLILPSVIKVFVMKLIYLVKQNMKYEKLTIIFL